MNAFFSSFSKMIAELSMGRKIMMGLILAVSITSIFYLVHLSNQSAMQPLFTSLNSQDLGSIVTFLDNEGVSYDVNQEQRTVFVKADKVLDLRLQLAQEGLPRFGGVGFELFDKAGFGLSDFEQKVTYQRALEGELSRTIAKIREIESARVHLVLPRQSLLSQSREEASASVILKLGSKGTLARSKVNAITHLVSSAVENLDPGKVSVIDTEGHLLTQGGGDSGVMASGQLFDQRIQIEKALEKRIVELLAPVVGYGKVIARVSSEIDFTRTESTNQLVDPSKVAVISESRSNSKAADSAGQTGGVAGAGSNLPGGAAGGATGGSGSSSDDSSEQIQYEVSRSIVKTVNPNGKIEKLSVAILVDGTYQQPAEGAEGEEAGPVYQARSAEEITKIENLVKNAIGFNADRGDQIKVENLQFQTPDTALAQTNYESKNTYGFLVTVISQVLILLMGLLVFFFVIRPLMRNWKEANPALGVGQGNPQLGSAPNPQLIELVKNDPQAAANAIRLWLKSS